MSELSATVKLVTLEASPLASPQATISPLSGAAIAPRIGVQYPAMRLFCCLLGIVFCCRAQQTAFPASDTNCPKYPEALRARWNAGLARDRVYDRFVRQARPSAITISIPRANFIDSLLFKRMAADGVQPAPLTTDAEFVRRIFLDLTGRIPQPEKVAAFLSDTTADKRSKLIEELLGSEGRSEED